MGHVHEFCFFVKGYRVARNHRAWFGDPEATLRRNVECQHFTPQHQGFLKWGFP